MIKKDISDEEYERIKEHIGDFLFTDLVVWRNEMINGKDVSIYSRLYELIDGEIKKRRISRDEDKSNGRSK